ncbi:MAG: Ig-like domain-containing protein [Nitrospirae bacterium]|nr:Ig-like domain-containing protein [Nitrospirota bacterium]
MMRGWVLFLLRGLAVMVTCLVPRLSHALLNTTWSKTDLTAQTYPRGKTHAVVLQIKADNPDALAQTVTSITVTRVNGADTDIATVHLFLDNGDGSFSSSSDSELGTAGAFSGSTKTFGGLSVSIPAVTGSKTFFVTYDLSTSATNGATLSAKINATGDIAQNPDGVAGTFPLSSLGTAATGGHSVNTTLSFTQTAQPSGGKARSSITAPYTVTYSDGTAVSAFSTDPTIKLRTGSTDATATLVWEAVSAPAGQWRVRWTVPDIQASATDYNFQVQASTAASNGNSGPAAAVTSSNFIIDTGISFSVTAQPGNGMAGSTISADVTATHSQGGAAATNFSTAPTVKVFKGTVETAAATWAAANAAAGQYRLQWTVPNLQASGTDYKFILSAGSGTDSGNNGPAAAVSSSTFTVDTQLTFQVAAQPVTAAAGDSAAADFTVTVSLDNSKVAQFDTAPTVKVLSGASEVATATWSTLDSTAGSYRATWSIPAGQASGSDYSFQMAANSGARSGNQGPAATVSTNKFSITNASLVWKSLPITPQKIPGGRKAMPLLTLLAHNDDVNGHEVRQIVLTSKSSSDTAVSSIHLYLDDGDQTFKASSDRELGTPGSFESGKKTFDFSTIVAPAADVVFFFTADLAAGAKTGTQLGAILDQKGHVGLEAGVAAKGTFPIGSLETAHTVDTTLTVAILQPPSATVKGSTAQMQFSVALSDGTKLAALSQNPTVEVVQGSSRVAGAVVELLDKDKSIFVARWDTAAGDPPAGEGYTLVVRSNTAKDGENVGPAEDLRSPSFSLRADTASQMGFFNGNGLLGGCVASRMPLEVRVTDVQGNSVEGVSITFTLPAGSDPSARLESGIVNTAGDGVARANLVIAEKVGRNTIQATRERLAGSPLNFSVDGTACTADAATSTIEVEPDSIGADGVTPVQVVATIRDAFGNPVGGKTVGFRSDSENDVFVTLDEQPLLTDPPDAVTTNPDGEARIGLTSFEVHRSTITSFVVEDDVSPTAAAAVDFIALPENRLFQNYPNPFDPRAEATVIPFNLMEESQASLIIYDSTGRPVRTVFEGSSRPLGPQTEKWDGKDSRGRALGNGRYTALLKTRGYAASIDIVLLAGGKSCFIATAVFGSSTAPEVVSLRRFRDDILLTSAIGRRFVEFYYRTSPQIARWLQDKPALRSCLRFLLSLLSRLLHAATA